MTKKNNPVLTPDKPENAKTKMDASNISVAILYPGNRVEKMSVPLAASDLDVAIEPPDAYKRDIVVADNADRDLGKEVLKNKLTDTQLVYRMRGDVFYELQLWDMHPIKHKIATDFVLPNVDGVIAVSDLLADKFTMQTGVSPTGSASLWIRPDEWPTVTHTDEELRIVTLTNPNYWKKVEACIEWAETVDTVLDEIGGYWHICGKGTNADRLKDGLEAYQHVSFAGYVDAKETLAQSNLMIHASNLDAFPNSILEGMAANLPVITNDFVAFENHPGPIDIQHTTDELRETLYQYEDPPKRRQSGRTGMQYVQENHKPEDIAVEYERYFKTLLSHE